MQKGQLPKHQVLCDLVYFFDCVLRCYHPAITTNNVTPALMPAPGTVFVKPPSKGIKAIELVTAPSR